MAKRRLIIVLGCAAAAMAACDAQGWRMNWKPLQWKQVNWRWWERQPAATATPAGVVQTRPATRGIRSDRRRGPSRPAEHVTRSLAEWRAWWSQWPGMDSPVVAPVLAVTEDRGNILVAVELGRGEAARIRIGDEYLVHPMDSAKLIARARVYAINEGAGEVYTRVIGDIEGRRTVQKGDLAVLQAPLR